MGTLRSILTISLLFICLSAHSQLKVSETGNFGIGTTNPLSRVSVNTDGDANRTMYVYNSGSERMAKFQLDNATGTYGIALNAIVSNSAASGYKHVAGNFQCYEPSENSRRTFGVRAHAGRGYDGANYAVYGGLVGSRNGGAIVGSIVSEPIIDGIYAGYFYGDVHIAGDLTVDGDYPGWSDLDIKRDVRFIENDVLEKLSTLQTIEYKIKVPERALSDTAAVSEVDSRLMKIYERDRIGLIAQELQVVYPELVTEGNDGNLRIKYLQVIPLLVKAINVQQEQLELLKQVISEQEEDIILLKDYLGLNDQEPAKKNAIESSAEPDAAIESNVPLLFQNVPNPFNRTTTIKYNIPELKGDASVNVYDLRGKQLQSYMINQSGEGTIEIEGSVFLPGIYLYNLIVDGYIVDSKQMVLTD
ncbi:MAG: tail fiber domain-containing protein [Bacteroidales bacterium]